MENKEWYENLNVDLTVEIGRDQKTIGEILTWRRGSNISLEQSVVNQLPIFVNNKKFGYGSILKASGGEMDLEIEKIFDSETK